MSRLDDNLQGANRPWTGMIQSAQPFGHYQRSSRSVVYLADPAKYSGGDVELLGKGSTPEGLTKSWVAKMPR